MVGQPYKILLELEMPESPANQKLGMFMACARLKSKDGDSVEESCRSAMIQYKSSFLHLISTVVLYPLLFSGSYEEKQLLAIELFSNFQEDSYNPVTDAHVELQSYTIEVYRASLKIHAHFTGLRFLMFHWPLTSAVMGICTNLFFLSVVAFLSWFKFFKPRQMTVHVGYDATKSKTLEERHAQAKERILSNRESTVILTDLKTYQSSLTLTLFGTFVEAKAAAAAPHLEIPKPQLNKEDLDPLFDEDEDEELTTLETSTELFDDEKDQVVPDLQGSGNSSTSDESERKSSSEFEVVGKTDEEDQGQHEKDFDEEKGQSKEDLESDIRQRKHK